MRFAFFLIFAALLPAQQTASVEGSVINSVTREPVKRALVRLDNRDARQNGATAITDDSGKFAASVTAGNYTVHAEAQGFTRRGATAITVAEGQKTTVPAIALAPAGTISGKVTGADSEPMQRVLVSANVYSYPDGVRKLMPVANVSTNDRGEFRLYNLPPHRYYLSVQAPGPQLEHKGRMHRQEPVEDYAATYYPNSPDASGAAPVAVTAGAETSGIDIRLRKVRFYHIRGRITGLPPNARGAVTLGTCKEGDREPFALSGSFVFTADWMNVAGPVEIINNGAGNLRPDGAFEISRAAPGDQCVIYGNNGVFARQEITVSDKDVENVTLAAAPPFQVSGSVIVEGAPTQPLSRVRIFLQSSGGQWGGANANVKPDGSFTVTNLVPLAYTVRVQTPSDLYFKSIRLGSREITDGHIQLTSAADVLTVVLASDGGTVNGVLQSPNDCVNCMVVLIPAGSPVRLDRSRATNAGRFTFTGIAPGEYQVFAVEDLDMDAMASPEYRKALQGKMVNVTVHPNGHETVEVPLISTGEHLAAIEKIQ